MSHLDTGRRLSQRMSQLAVQSGGDPERLRGYWNDFRWREASRQGAFVERHGHLMYRQVMSPPMRTWRLAILGVMRCEIDPHHRTPESDYLFDHCHEHGWVRAVVCPSCNVKLGQLDAARKLAGITVVLGDAGFGRIAARCPYCVPDHARHGCPDPI